MPKQTYLLYEDEDGQTSRSSFFVEDAAADVAALDDLESAIDAVSNAAIRKSQLAVLDRANGAPAPENDAPYDIADKVVLEYLDTAGKLSEITVPAPDPNIFSDSDNVDLTQTTPGTYDNSALQAADVEIKANLRSTGGESFTSLVRGYRTRSSRKL